MKILIAVDDSPCSDAAVQWVKHATWAADTEFIVLSAARSPVLAYAVPGVPATSYAGDLYEEERKYREDITTRYERQLRLQGFATKAIVEPGDPREVILSVARSHRVDLIVLGSHGRSGIPKLMLGSVASHVVTHAPCSVLVVKDSRFARSK